MGDYTFTIFLSASVPSEKRDKKYLENYTRIENAQIQIEEAVIGLARNIFQAGGRIVFGGHPSISPLVAMVATEFNTDKGVGNKPITIYQSRAFEAVISKGSTDLLALGCTDIVWTDAVAGERFDPEIKGKSQFEKSLALMRGKMIQERLDAMVCMGGMEGVEAEFEIFRKIHPEKPVFILASTGGASKILADAFPHNDLIRVPDKEYVETAGREKERGAPARFNIIPYSFLTALIVKEVAGGRQQPDV